MAQGVRRGYFLAAAAAVVVSAILILTIICIRRRPPLYYASIVSVSGDLGPQLQFNFALGVQSRSPLWRRACIERGTTLGVAYHGVELLYGISDWELCAVPRQVWTVRYVMANMVRSGNMSGLPEFVVEGLQAADARRGVQVFDVTMHIPSTGRRDGVGGKLVACMGRLVGANACDVHYYS